MEKSAEVAVSRDANYIAGNIQASAMVTAASLAVVAMGLVFALMVALDNRSPFLFMLFYLFAFQGLVIGLLALKASGVVNDIYYGRKR